MASKFELYQFKPGEKLKLKKQHPCGSYTWTILRAGADISLKCVKCSRQMNMQRRQLEKAVKEIIDDQTKSNDMTT